MPNESPPRSLAGTDSRDRLPRLPRRNRSLLETTALPALLGVAFLLLRSDGLQSDGARYEALIAAGSLANPHFAYLPLAATLAPFLDAHDAGTAASAAAAGAGALLVLRARPWRRGASTALLAAALLLLAPALLAQAGALEVHAAAFALSAAAFALALGRGSPCSRSQRCVASGFALVLGHLSSVLWLPALAWVAAGDARTTPSGERMRRALACAAGATAGMGLIFASGWWAAPLPGEQLSPLRSYLRDWLSGAALPRSTSAAERWITEVAGALGPLLPLALCGAALALRRGLPGAAGLALALAPGPVLALAIGAFESGAYLLPGLPALVWLAALALRELARAGTFAAWLALLAIAAESAARCAWAGGAALPRGALSAGDAGLHAGTAELAASLAAPAPLAWICFSTSALAALAAGVALAARAHGPRRARPLGLAVVAIALALQGATAHASSTRTPSRDQRELADFGRRFERSPEHRTRQILVSVEPTPNARAILGRSVGRERALFLPTRAYGAVEPELRDARVALDARIAAGPAYFPADLFAPLVAARDEEALAWVREREASGRLVRLPAERFASFTPAPRWDARAAAYAERCSRELPPDARLVTCVPDAALRGTLAALLQRPFVDLAVDPVPLAREGPVLHLCDEGLSYAQALAEVSALHAERLRALRELRAQRALERWPAPAGPSRDRADAFWEAAPAGR